MAKRNKLCKTELYNGIANLKPGKPSSMRALCNSYRDATQDTNESPRHHQQTIQLAKLPDHLHRLTPSPPPTSTNSTTVSLSSCSPSPSPLNTWHPPLNGNNKRWPLPRHFHTTCPQFKPKIPTSTPFPTPKTMRKN